MLIQSQWPGNRREFNRWLVESCQDGLRPEPGFERRRTFPLHADIRVDSRSLAGMPTDDRDRDSRGSMKDLCSDIVLAGFQSSLNIYRSGAGGNEGTANGLSPDRRHSASWLHHPQEPRHLGFGPEIFVASGRQGVGFDNII